MAKILRGEIYWANLDPVKGREQAGEFPVLILSQDVFNERSGVVIAVALTSQPQKAGFPLTLSRAMKRNDVVMAVSGNPGLPAILMVDAYIHDGFVGFRNLSDAVMPEYLYHLFSHLKEHSNPQSIGAVFKNLTTGQIKDLNIPLPPLSIQRQIVAELEAERALVEANRKLAEIFEKKIQAKLAEVWGEKENF